MAVWEGVKLGGKAICGAAKKVGGFFKGLFSKK
jgi:hypothetical protein